MHLSPAMVGQGKEGTRDKEQGTRAAGQGNAPWCKQKQPWCEQLWFHTSHINSEVWTSGRGREGEEMDLGKQ